ncbi:hypothetical protein G6F65_022218 [Rhizopus arrhizus]|nr:hypothetical protein G6F65_022218 [Rhizopus arrhizus]
MVRRHERAFVVGDVRPQQVHFGLGPDWRIVLGLGAEAAGMFLVVQHQVLHAGLDAGVMAFLPVHVADLEAARGRHVHRVGARAGFRPDLVDQRGGQVFDQRRAQCSCASSPASGCARRKPARKAQSGGRRRRGRLPRCEESGPAWLRTSRT